jgi:hypothetical protein
MLLTMLAVVGDTNKHDRDVKTTTTTTKAESHSSPFLCFFAQILFLSSILKFIWIAIFLPCVLTLIDHQYSWKLK